MDINVMYFNMVVSKAFFEDHPTLTLRSWWDNCHQYIGNKYLKNRI